MMQSLIKLVQSMLEQNGEEETESECMLMGLDDANCTKGYMANSTLWTCSLGCQLLGLCHYACGGNNLPPMIVCFGWDHLPPSSSSTQLMGG